MAIPTNFQGYTPAAGTTKSFKILGSATVGIWGNDVDGTFTPVLIPLAPNLSLIMITAYTDAEIIEYMKTFIKRYGGNVSGAAGGEPAQATLQQTPTSTTCT